MRVGSDPELCSEIVATHEAERKRETKEASRSLSKLEQQRLGLAKSFKEASAKGDVSTLADCQRQQIEVEETMALLKTRIAELTENVLSEGHLRGAVEAFKPAWESLALQERIRLLRLLVQEVVYDGETGEIAITFYPNGIKSIEVA